MTHRLLATLTAAALLTGCTALDDPPATAMPTIPATVPDYDRDAFGDWTDTDNDGCSTRDEILARDAIDVTIGVDGCAVKVTIVDPYTGRQLTGWTDIDVDHIVPLRAAWDGGAWAWTDEQREQFANDPGNLLATEDSVNSSKSDRTVSEWLPPHPAAHCDYGHAWAAVLDDYQLTAAQADLDAVAGLVAAC